MLPISGYMTCLQALEHGHPVTECVEALGSLCSEVIVVDGGSADGTWDHLRELAAARPWLRVEQRIIDRDDPRWAIAAEIDLKARARELCTSDFCWHANAEEVVGDGTAELIARLVEHWPGDLDAVAVPFLEYWGGLDRVRADRPIGRVRLSRNAPHLTHAVPRPLRRFDAAGAVYLARFHRATDALVERHSRDLARTSSLVDPEVERLRHAAAAPGPAGRLGRCRYQVALSRLLEEAPCAFDLSSFSLVRKVRVYRAHGAAADASLFDAAGFFDESPFGKPWREVDDDEIRSGAHDLLAAGPPTAAGPGPLVRSGKMPPSILEPWMISQSDAPDEGGAAADPGVPGEVASWA